MWLYIAMFVGGLFIGSVTTTLYVSYTSVTTVTAPIAREDCDTRMAKLLADPSCHQGGKRPGYLDDFGKSTHVEPNAMPKLGYEEKDTKE